MRATRTTRTTRATTIALLLLPLATLACRDDAEPDAYGNFEATEVVVSAQASGTLLWLAPQEGERVAPGTLLGVIDTTQLDLERRQLLAQRGAAGSRQQEVGRQVAALQAQHEVAVRTLERTRRLMAAQAATAQQLDQAERDARVLAAQLEAARAQRQGVGHDAAATDARVARLRDLVEKSRIHSPVEGTVLATYVRAGEQVQAGQPILRVAPLDTLELRAYVSQPQLASIRLGQQVTVTVDRGDGARLTVPGTISWIAARAEFTPTPIQTRDERAELVYALKVRVPNPDGALKIGMPADVSLRGPGPS